LGIRILIEIDFLMKEGHHPAKNSWHSDVLSQIHKAKIRLITLSPLLKIPFNIFPKHILRNG